MEKVENKRVLYLDIIKTISILLVVFCHMPILRKESIIDNIAMILCWAAVPCFFMTTGALLLNKEWNFKKYLKKLMTLYVVICIWKIIYLIFFHCIEKIDMFHTSKKSILNYVFLFSSIQGVNDGHFWFMYAYLSIYIIYPLFNICFKNTKELKYFLIVITIIIFAFSILPQILELGLEFFKIKNISINSFIKINPFGGYPHMLLYFIIGGFLYRYNIYERYVDKKKIIRLLSIFIMVLGTIGLLLVKKNHTGTFEWNDTYLHNGYKWSSTVLLSVGIFICLQGINIKRKTVNKIFSAIGANTIGIYYLHILVLSFISNVKIMHRGFAVNSLKTIMVSIICYVIAIVLKKIPVVKKIVQ